MHRALLIAEVQREVLSWVDEAKSALALALTARAFLEAGLDFTWRHGTVYDLALTMPPKYRSAVLIQKGIMIVSALSIAVGSQLILHHGRHSLKLNDHKRGWAHASYSTPTASGPSPSVQHRKS